MYCPYKIVSQASQILSGPSLKSWVAAAHLMKSSWIQLQKNEIQRKLENTQLNQFENAKALFIGTLLLYIHPLVSHIYIIYLSLWHTHR